MVKLKGPLQSISAQGKIGDVLTFSQRRSGSQVRFQHAQVVPTATTQQTQREYFEEATANWSTLTSSERQQWHDFVKGL